MKMKAFVLYERKADFQLEEVDMIEPRALEIRVKLVSTGICHTDIAQKDNEWGMELALPMILGHEGAGIVESIGPGVTKVKPGDKVIISNPSCGSCEMCAKGMPWYCEQNINLHLLTDGVDYYEGTHMTNSKGQGIYTLFNQSSFAEYVLAHERTITKIDDDFDLKIAGPLGCGLRTGSGAVYNYIMPKPMEWVVVTGAGAVGLSAMWMANAFGAKTVVLDINQKRLDDAKRLGATAVLNTKDLEDDEITAKLKEICDGKGPDHMVEGSGFAEAVKPALRAVRYGGKMAQCGMAGQVSFSHYMNDANDAHNLQFVHMGNVDNDVIINVLVKLYKDGKFPFDQIQTYYDFEDIKQAMQDSLDGKVTKPVLLFK